MNRKLLDRIRGMDTAELYRAMYTDPVTWVLNRAAFEEAGPVPAVAIVDMDSLKYVNDTFGHRTGDSCLARLARALVAEFGTDHVYRIAGDEFAVTGEDSRALAAGLERARYAMCGFSYGVGADLIEADRYLRREKKCREFAGLRAARGEAPPWGGVEAKIVC